MNPLRSLRTSDSGNCPVRHAIRARSYKMLRIASTYSLKSFSNFLILCLPTFIGTCVDIVSSGIAFLARKTVKIIKLQTHVVQFMKSTFINVTQIIRTLEVCVVRVNCRLFCFFIQGLYVIKILTCPTTSIKFSVIENSEPPNLEFIRCIFCWRLTMSARLDNFNFRSQELSIKVVEFIHSKWTQTKKEVRF